MKVYLAQCTQSDCSILCNALERLPALKLERLEFLAVLSVSGTF